MASLIPEGGRCVIQFVQDGKRHSYRLGEVNKRDAVQVKRFIEDLLCCQRTGKVFEPSTQGWLAGLPGAELRKLQAWGLVSSAFRRVSPVTFDKFVRQYIASRSDVKPNTLMNYWQAHRLALPMLGEKFLSEITLADGENLRVELLRRKKSQGYIGRRLKIVRQFLAAAVAGGLIEKNPWAAVKCGDWSDKSRMVYVKPQDVQSVIKACPDAEWRLIVALCRFGGLRCPSEVLAVKWQDIDWDRERFTVHASKTERLEDGGVRIVPIFPELRQWLLEAYQHASEGAVYAIQRYRDRSCNLRTQFKRIIKRAGLTAWGKLFQNLRSSCETDLSRRFPLHVVTSWLGNSPRVAQKHYLQVTEEDFTRAAGVVQNPVQHVSESVSESRQADSVTSEKSQKMPGNLQVYSSVPNGAACETAAGYARQDSNL